MYFIFTFITISRGRSGKTLGSEEMYAKEGGRTSVNKHQAKQEFFFNAVEPRESAEPQTKKNT